jgi:hypothetical protein
MVRRKAETFEPVTMGHIRGHGCRDLQMQLNNATGRTPSVKQCRNIFSRDFQSQPGRRCVSRGCRGYSVRATFIHRAGRAGIRLRRSRNQDSRLLRGRPR